MLRKIAATRRDDRATMWLLDTYRPIFAFVGALMCLPLVLKVAPWWIVFVVLAGSVFVTRIRFVRGDQPVARVAVLWLGLVPIWRRHGAVRIGLGCSDENVGDIPGNDEVTLDFRGSDPWSFQSARAPEIAEWLHQAHSDLRKAPGGAPAGPVESKNEGA
jgi:hypothetical protein